jgi:phosphatidylglycerol---prolipoprotein diacylglyceryl transferase
MFEINIDPVAFTLGRLDVSWASLMTEIALVVSFFLYFFQGKYLGIQKKHLLISFALFIVCGFIGGRLFSLLETFISHPSIIFDNGLTARMPGVLLGIIATIFVDASLMKRSVSQVADVGIVGLYAFIAIYRIGCVLNGCCSGIHCDLPWSVMYANINTAAPPMVSLHPTQFYHLLATGLVVIVAFVLQKKSLPAGSTALFALIFYSVGDLVIRFYREGEPGVLGPLSLSQITALLVIFIATLLLFVQHSKQRRLQPIHQAGHHM